MMYRPSYLPYYVGYYSSRRLSYLQRYVAKVDRASKKYRDRQMYLLTHPKARKACLQKWQRAQIRAQRRKLVRAKYRYRRDKKIDRHRYKYASKKNKRAIKQNESNHRWYIRQIQKNIKWLKIGKEIRVRTCTDDSIPTTIGLKPEDLNHGPKVLKKAISNSVTYDEFQWDNVVQARLTTRISREDFVKTVIILQSIYHNAKIDSQTESKIALLTYYFGYYRHSPSVKAFMVEIPLFYSNSNGPLEDRIKKLRKYQPRKLLGWYVTHAMHIGIKLSPIRKG